MAESKYSQFSFHCDVAIKKIAMMAKKKIIGA
jgi:hypothetical protein